MFIQNANQRLNVRNVVIEIMMLSGSLFRSGVDTVTADLFLKHMFLVRPLMNAIPLSQPVI